MDLAKGVGSLMCRMCSASYQMPIHHLHEPIDVFSEWLDDCEAAEQGEVAAASSSNQQSSRSLSKVVHDTSQDYDDDDEDDDLPEASGLGQKRPAQKSGGGGTKSAGLDDSDEESDW